MLRLGECIVYGPGRSPRPRMHPVPAGGRASACARPRSVARAGARAPAPACAPIYYIEGSVGKHEDGAAIPSTHARSHPDAPVPELANEEREGMGGRLRRPALQHLLQLRPARRVHLLSAARGPRGARVPLRRGRGTLDHVLQPPIGVLRLRRPRCGWGCVVVVLGDPSTAGPGPLPTNARPHGGACLCVVRVRALE